MKESERKHMKEQQLHEKFLSIKSFDIILTDIKGHCSIEMMKYPSNNVQIQKSCCPQLISIEVQLKYKEVNSIILTLYHGKPSNIF